MGLDFAKAFDLRLVEQTTASWEFWYGLLQRYVEREGNARVTKNHKAHGYRLGGWVSKQRSRKEVLLSDRRVRLEALPGWTWDKFRSQWEDAYEILRKYTDRENSSRVPQGHVEDGFSLGLWVTIQRRKRHKLSDQNVRRLEALVDWSWDPREDRWAEAFCSLKNFIDREGHMKAPRGHLENGVLLESWIIEQRQGYKKGILPKRRIEMLEGIEEWAWNPHDARWKEGLASLRRFIEREGHARVPQFHMEGEFRLGNWVTNHRGEYRRGRMPSERVEIFESIEGWAWNTKEAQWLDGYNYLKEYALREGHAKVPQSHVERGYKLGFWVSNQRSRRRKLDSDQKSLLEQLPGWDWGKRKSN